MDETTPPQPQNFPSDDKKVWLFVGLLLIFAVIVGGYLAYQKGLFPIDTGKGSGEIAKPTGTLYFTTTPYTQSSVTGSYTYNLETREKNSLSFIQNTEEFFPAFGDGGRTVAALFRDEKGADSVKLVERASGSELISIPVAKENSVYAVAVSRSGRDFAFLFANPTAIAKTYLRPSSWRISATFSGSNSNPSATSGVSPIFISGSNELYYIGDDGMYSLSPSGKAVRVWDMDGATPASFMGLAAASEAPVIAFTNPEEAMGKGIVQVFSVTSMSPFSINPLLTIRDIQASRVRLSPDGTFVALQIPAVEGTLLPGAGVIRIISTADGSVAKELDLSGYNKNIRISSWLYE